MLVGVLGINHKLASLKLREALIHTAKRKFSPCSSIHSKHFLVLLSTCNRTEIYFHSEDLAETHTYILSILRHEIKEEFDQKLYSYFGFDCFLHLARVTAGLDSAILAETEIQGQVKDAYESSQISQNLPKELHFLFQKALKTGKKIRFKSSLERGMPSLEHALFKLGKTQFAKPQNEKILFIGASEINCKVLRYFKLKNFCQMTLSNRTEETGKKMARKWQTDFLPWEELCNWKDYSWIICGTKAPNYLIENSFLFKSITDNKLMIDLSVPRNIDPSIGHHPNITLFNMDEISALLNCRTKNREETIQKAEEMIFQETEKHLTIFKEKENFIKHILHITA
ncbi:MAG TPA: glutamyl-tRNA reductase [Parachlamydiaceae bacterium]|nr:glutamyl-tRNA reductase [Parachlamydiaceae bacterium]